jgi:DNA-binding LacI/PurR family transcriptional regulator
VVPHLTRPSAAERLAGALTVLTRHEYDTIVCNVDSPAQRDHILAMLAARHRADGVLVVSLPVSRTQLAAFRQAGVPVAAVDVAVRGVPHTVIDDVAGGQLATSHLLSLGHRRIGFIGDQAPRAASYLSRADHETVNRDPADPRADPAAADPAAAGPGDADLAAAGPVVADLATADHAPADLARAGRRARGRAAVPGGTATARRLAGYRQALAAAGVPPDDKLVRLGPHGPASAQALATELLALPDPPSAIFAASDTQAMGVLAAADRSGAQVPRQLSVVGFDDIQPAALLGLSTVRQPLERSGAEGAERLCALLRGEKVRPLRQVLAVAVVPRASSGRPGTRPAGPSPNMPPGPPDGTAVAATAGSAGISAAEEGTGSAGEPASSRGAGDPAAGDGGSEESASSGSGRRAAWAGGRS